MSGGAMGGAARDGAGQLTGDGVGRWAGRQRGRGSRAEAGRPGLQSPAWCLRCQSSNQGLKQ